MTIAALINRLGDIKLKSNDLYKEYKGLKELEDTMKLELTAQLEKLGAKSFKGEKYSASMSQRTDVVVTHEQSVIDWLKESPEVEEDAYIGLKVTPFKAFAKQVLKETGEIVPGTDLTTTESLAIKANK